MRNRLLAVFRRAFEIDSERKIIKDILVPRNDTDGKEFLSDWKGIESIQDVSKQFLEYEKA